MFSRALGAVFLLTLAFAIIGCSSLFSAVLEEPKVALHSVQVRDNRADGATAVVAVNVENPNRIAITVDRLEYSLEMGGKEIAKAGIDNFARVEAKSTAKIEIPVPFLYATVVSSLLDLVQKGTSSYKVKGMAKVGIFNLPFEHTGDVKLRQ